MPTITRNATKKMEDILSPEEKRVNEYNEKYNYFINHLNAYFIIQFDETNSDTTKIKLIIKGFNLVKDNLDWVLDDKRLTRVLFNVYSKTLESILQYKLGQLNDFRSDLIEEYYELCNYLYTPLSLHFNKVANSTEDISRLNLTDSVELMVKFGEIMKRI